MSHDELRDPLYEDAVKAIGRRGEASEKVLQQSLLIGYNRAARLIEEMVKQGLVSPMGEWGRRTILRDAWKTEAPDVVLPEP